MQNLLRLEEALLFILGAALFNGTGYSWWLFWVLLLAPDISMLGYLLNEKTGAWLYNVFHHKGLAVALYLLGVWVVLPPLQLAGIILFSHSSLDRVFGYGLKYIDSFKHTHLGWMRKN